jgi:hypothetical protein
MSEPQLINKKRKSRFADDTADNNQTINSAIEKAAKISKDLNLLNQAPQPIEIGNIQAQIAAQVFILYLSNYLIPNKLFICRLLPSQLYYKILAKRQKATNIKRNLTGLCG